jgi:hypothetical protein
MIDQGAQPRDVTLALGEMFLSDNELLLPVSEPILLFDQQLNQGWSLGGVQFRS